MKGINILVTTVQFTVKKIYILPTYIVLYVIFTPLSVISSMCLVLPFAGDTCFRFFLEIYVNSSIQFSILCFSIDHKQALFYRQFFFLKLDQQLQWRVLKSTVIKTV